MLISDWSSDVCSSDLNPVLDYTLQRPVTTLAKRAWIDNRKAEQEMALRNLSKRYGIFYFYAQSCGACDIFAPILRSLADGSGFNVVAVSMDGGPNRVFPNYVVDVGQHRSEEHTSELQSLMRISYAVFCFKKKNTYKVCNT